ncbi:MAG: hypothetical protein ACQETB_13830 [Halobacteriota archaeon]
MPEAGTPDRFVVHVWRDQFTGSAVEQHAQRALESLDEQVDATVDLVIEGQLSLPHAPYSTYGAYVDHFRAHAPIVTGELNTLLYSASLLKGYLACGALERYPYLGYCLGQYRPDSRPVTLVNAAVLGFDPVVDASGLFENMVLHELLHSVGADHEHGQNHDEANSPMLSGYVESYSTNEPPETTCADTPPATNVDAWTDRLSSCSKALFEARLDEYYR